LGRLFQGRCGPDRWRQGFEDFGSGDGNVELVGDTDAGEVATCTSPAALSLEDDQPQVEAVADGDAVFGVSPARLIYFLGGEGVGRPRVAFAGDDDDSANVSAGADAGDDATGATTENHGSGVNTVAVDELQSHFRVWGAQTE
jgi:hypothetical protein